MHFPRKAAWIEALRNEVLQFPNGKHDDQVDSITQLLKHMNPEFFVREVDIFGY